MVVFELFVLSPVLFISHPIKEPLGSKNHPKDGDFRVFIKRSFSKVMFKDLSLTKIESRWPLGPQV